MDKVKMTSSTDTESSIDEKVRVIPQSNKRNKTFDYTYFCRTVMERTKRWGDALFLVPLKLLKECDEITDEKFYARLERWMKIFKDKEGSVDYFWIYMVYSDGYDKFKEQVKDDEIRRSIDHNVSDNAKTYMNDVSKLGQSKYITQLCEKDDMSEYWILKVYEITFKQIYSSADMARVVDRIIVYLQECEIRIERPAFIDYSQSENEIYSFVSNLMLYVTRLYVNIDPERALRKYKKGNVAYSRYRDQMLAEYIRLSDMYFYQSYERLVKMKACAMEGGNKYAAKEVGDIYRLGMELQDMHGNRVVIEVDEKTACEYYRICLDAKHIPAYVAAVKTGALINARQREAILKEAAEEKNPEGLAYCAEKYIREADANEETESGKAIKFIEKAVDCMVYIEDSYVEKHILKNALLQSKAFISYKNGELGRNAELNKMLKNLYSKDVIAMDEEGFLAEMEKTYIAAGECGFFEAEYRLGKLFQDSDADKSNKYFEQGKEKGCVWCLLECAQLQREQDPAGWLRTMIELGRNMNGDNTLHVRMAEEWTSSGNILAQVVNGSIQLKMNEIMDIYLQLGSLYKCMYGKGEEYNEIKRNIKLSSKLIEQQESLEELILRKS